MGLKIAYFVSFDAVVGRAMEGNEKIAGEFCKPIEQEEVMTEQERAWLEARWAEFSPKDFVRAGESRESLQGRFREFFSYRGKGKGNGMATEKTEVESLKGTTATEKT